MKRDVRISLGTDDSPQWLRSAMDHKCDLSFRSLLGSAGMYDGAFKLLSGCLGAPSPHRALIEPIDGDIGATAPPSPVSDWSSKRCEPA